MGFKELFNEDFSASSSAHARVNLIGEHTDYTGGYVLPSLLKFHTTVQVSKNDEKKSMSQPCLLFVKLLLNGWDHFMMILKEELKTFWQSNH